MATKRRHFPGKAEVAFLLPLLNKGPESERAAIQEIVLTLKELSNPILITHRGVMEGTEALSAQGRRLDNLNRTLRAYRAIPSIGIRPSKNGPKLKVRWRRIREGSTRRGQTIGAEELDAVMLALQLAEDGLIHKIIRCGICGIWCFGKGKNSKWCGDTCKTANYRTEPEKRKHAKAEQGNRARRLRGRPRAKRGRKPA